MSSSSSSGKDEAAIRELRAILAERPGDAHVQNALGYTLADHDRNLAEARQLVAAALAQSPDNAATLDSMGWVLFREGNYPAALEHLQHARRNGADPEIDLHIGEVQWAMGDQKAARATWRAALAKAPTNEKLRARIERKWLALGFAGVEIAEVIEQDELVLAHLAQRRHGRQGKPR